MIIMTNWPYLGTLTMHSLSPLWSIQWLEAQLLEQLEKVNLAKNTKYSKTIEISPIEEW